MIIIVMKFYFVAKFCCEILVALLVKKLFFFVFC